MKCEHRILYVKTGTLYGIKCRCGAELWLETANALVHEGADLVQVVSDKLHASAIAHVRNIEGTP